MGMIDRNKQNFENSIICIANSNSDSLLILKQIFENRKKAALEFFKTENEEKKSDLKEYINHCNKQIKISLGIVDL
jgi:hypothetical protein